MEATGHPYGQSANLLTKGHRLSDGTIAQARCDGVYMWRDGYVGAGPRLSRPRVA